MVVLHCECEIAASPEEVRSIFLDFKSYPEWSKNSILKVTSLEKDGSFKVGSKIHAVLKLFPFSGTIEKNDDEGLIWYGGAKGLVVGHHGFYYKPSAITPGHTTFLQEERWEGIFSWAVSSSLPAGKIAMSVYEKFNVDIKARAESRATATDSATVPTATTSAEKPVAAAEPPAVQTAPVAVATS